ncbi:MAG: TPM domain-containing protein, partial [Mycobacterium sp.]
MRIARVVSLLVAVLTAALVLSPAVIAEGPLRLQTHVTDAAGVLDSAETARVEQSLNALYDRQRIQVWVVYVNNFVNDAGQLTSGEDWAQTTALVNNFDNRDVLLAVAPMASEFGYFVQDYEVVPQARLDAVVLDSVRPALRDRDFAGAAVALADGLNGSSSSSSSSSAGGGISWVTLLIILAVFALAIVALMLWSRSRRRKRRAAELEAAKRVDPTDPAALATVPIDALDDLSKEIVVDVDNAVRTSDSELALAVEEFGAGRTQPFTDALGGAKTALAQAFNVRQVLDDAVPETPEQRRDLLIRVIVAAARADRDLDRQSDAFEELRNLVINAPTRLDTLTQQMVDVTARLAPSAQTLNHLRGQFSETALSAVAGNVDAATERAAFADHNVTTARRLVSAPATDQTALVDAVRAAESALGQASTLLDAVNSAASDINRAIASLPDAIADTQRGIDAAGAPQGRTTQAAELAKAREAAIDAVADAQRDGSSDPLGTFTRLTKAN